MLYVYGIVVFLEKLMSQRCIVGEAFSTFWWNWVGPTCYHAVVVKSFYCVYDETRPRFTETLCLRYNYFRFPRALCLLPIVILWHKRWDMCCSRHFALCIIVRPRSAKYWTKSSAAADTPRDDSCHRIFHCHSRSPKVVRNDTLEQGM